MCSTLVFLKLCVKDFSECTLCYSVDIFLISDHTTFLYLYCIWKHSETFLGSKTIQDYGKEISICETKVTYLWWWVLQDYGKQCLYLWTVTRSYRVRNEWGPVTKHHFLVCILLNYMSHSIIKTIICIKLILKKNHHVQFEHLWALYNKLTKNICRLTVKISCLIGSIT